RRRSTPAKMDGVGGNQNGHYVVQLQQQPHQGTQGVGILFPPGTTMQQVPPAPYAHMQGNVNARAAADVVVKSNMQWQYQQQQNIMQPGMGGVPQYMQQQQMQQQPMQQQQMGYTNTPAGYYLPKHQQQYAHKPVSTGMCLYHGQMMQQYLQQPMNALQAQQALHQGGAAGVAADITGMQQSSSGAPIWYAGSMVVQHSPTMNQPRPNVPAPAEPRKRNILSVVDPNTVETVEKETVEATQRDKDEQVLEQLNGTEEENRELRAENNRLRSEIEKLEKKYKKMLLMFGSTRIDTPGAEQRITNGNAEDHIRTMDRSRLTRSFVTI
ncbi:hypothetical protein PFISCL1PPCAC_4818, partial [Pristionchus fissidentatus]